MNQPHHDPPSDGSLNLKLGESRLKTGWSLADCDDEWDDFLSNTLGAHHEQTCRWARIKKHQGWQCIRVVCRDERQIVSGAQLLCHRVRPFGVVGYVPRGPCLAERSDRLSQLTIQALLKAARQAGVWYLAVDLPHTGHFLEAHCTSAGLWPSPAHLPPARMMAASSVIDLSLPEPELLARMRKSTRHNIRQGLRHGVRVREGTEDDLGVFFDLMLATCRRRGEAPNPGSLEFFQQFWRELRPPGWARLSIAECDGDAVAAELAVPFSDTHRLWKFGWSGQYRNYNVSDVLCWDSITWARRNGFKHLDLVQVDPVVVAAMAKGNINQPEVMARRLYGPTVHKTGFGGRITHLPGAYSSFVHPTLRGLNPVYRIPLLRQVGARIAGWIAKRAWGRSAGSS